MVSRFLDYGGFAPKRRPDTLGFLFYCKKAPSPELFSYSIMPLSGGTPPTAVARFMFPRFAFSGFGE